MNDMIDGDGDASESGYDSRAVAEVSDLQERKEFQMELLAGEWLEDLGGKFRAKLREVLTKTRQSADGKTMTTFKLAQVEACYDPHVVQSLSPGQLLAIPNVRNLASDKTFSVFEIADVTPMHYSMLTLSTSQPGALRGEFMGLIDREWKKGSKSNWIDILASPTGYIADLSSQGSTVSFERKYSPLLVGAEVRLLSEKAVKQFVCYLPRDNARNPDEFCIGGLLGVIDKKVPFTIDFTQLINYHVGVFCHTGGGKSYLTSMILRKALKADPDLKVVVVDVSSEYGIHLLDQLVTLPSRMILPFEFEEASRTYDARGKAAQFYRKHVVPDALELKHKELKFLIEKLFAADKCRSLYMPPQYVLDVKKYRTYEGLLESVAQTAREKFNVNQQASIYVMDQIRSFLRKNDRTPEETIDGDFMPVIKEINNYLDRSGVKSNSTIRSMVSALEGRIAHGLEEPEELGYDMDMLVSELLDGSQNSPRLFVVNEETERARIITSQLIEGVFKERRTSFNLHPRILFVFDEAQEFAPNESSFRLPEGAVESTHAVERLLRHGRKYHLHGWISTQRLAHLNTSALHQIHSYFVGTLPRPYDRQLVGDTFAIDDTLLERTLNFEPGDWLLASFRATKTQNVPVFFHAINNEDCILAV